MATALLFQHTITLKGNEDFGILSNAVSLTP